MKLFKKFLVAAGLVGLVGSFGFASNTLAATTYKPVMTVGAQVSGTTVTWYPVLENDPNTPTVVDDLDTTEVEGFVSGDQEWYLDDYEIKSVAIATKTGGTLITITDSDKIQDGSIDLTDTIKSKALNEVSGKVTVTVTYNYTYYLTTYTKKTDESGSYIDYTSASDPKTANGQTASEETADTITPFYKVTVKTDNASLGTVKVDGTSFSEKSFICSPTDYPSVVAEATKDGYQFQQWKENSSTNSTLDLSGITKPSTFTAVFNNPSEVSFTATVWASDGSTKIGTVDATSADKNAGLYVGQYIQFGGKSGTSINGINTSYLEKVSGKDGWYKAIAATTDSFKVYGTKDGYASANVVVTIKTSSYLTLTDYVDYITDGYTLEFKAKASDGAKNMKWGISDGSDYIDKIDYDNYSDSTQTVKVVFKKKLDNGDNNKTVKIKCMVGDSSTAYKIKKNSDVKDADAVTELSITVYSRSKLEFKSGDRSLEYTGSDKGNSGNESVGSDCVKMIADADGVYIQALRDSSVIGKSDKYIKEKGNKFTVAGSEVETMVLNMSDKFSGDKDKVKFRFCMAGKDKDDKSGKWNDKVYGETDDLPVYRVVIKVTGSGSTTKTTTTDTNKNTSTGGGVAMNTALPVAFISPAGDLVATASSSGKEYVYYGLEGQVIDLNKLGVFSSLTNGTTDVASTGKVTVSSDPAKNTYTGVLGERTESGDLDKVPRTGQSNMSVYLMVALIACAVCAALYAYNRKAKNI